jgi:hypothetical protein
MTSFPSTAVLYGGYVTDKEDANPLVPYLNRSGRNQNYSSVESKLDNSQLSQHENGRGHNYMHHHESSVSCFTSVLPNLPPQYTPNDALTLVIGYRALMVSVKLDPSTLIWTAIVTCCRGRLTLDGTKLTISTTTLTAAAPVPIAAIHHGKTLTFGRSLDIKVINLYVGRSKD